MKSAKSFGNGEVIVHPNGWVGERQPQFPCVLRCLLPLLPAGQAVLCTHSDLTTSISSGPASALTTGLGQEWDLLSPPQPRAFPPPTPASCRLPSPSPCRLPLKTAYFFKASHFAASPRPPCAASPTSTMGYTETADLRTSEGMTKCTKATCLFGRSEGEQKSAASSSEVSNQPAAELGQSTELSTPVFPLSVDSESEEASPNPFPYQGL